MTITNVLTLVENLADMDVQDLNTKLVGQPLAVNAGDLPASYIRGVVVTEGPLTAKTHGGWPEFTVEYIVLVKPLQLGTPQENFEDTVDMLNSVAKALRALPEFDYGGTNTENVGRGPLEWTLEKLDEHPIGDTYYWAVLATVTAYG